jgi:AefR-like transcriptional repressor, C-terminal domain
VKSGLSAVAIETTDEMIPPPSRIWTAGRYPELASRFFENGPKRGEDAFARYLANQIERSQLKDEDPLMMAR